MIIFPDVLNDEHHMMYRNVLFIQNKIIIIIISKH